MITANMLKRQASVPGLPEMKRSAVYGIRVRRASAEPGSFGV